MTARLERERRPVSVVFADVVGSTALADDRDPEEWLELIQPALARMSDAVRAYDGHVAQLLGDGVLAFFGAPVAHEDDPERAVRAGLAIVDAMRSYGDDVQRRHGIDFGVRVGINTGTAVVGSLTAAAPDYSAYGDVVNVAARVESEAQPGTVLITDDTRRALRGALDVIDRGAVSLKGKREPVSVYEVVGWHGHLHDQRGLAGVTSPLVGREAELSALRELASVVRAGRGRMAIVTGEPGIGKTRLLRELRASATEADGRPPLAWHDGRALSYGRNVPYHLLVDLVRSLIGLHERDAATDPGELSQRLAAAARDEAAEIEPYVAHLLSVHHPVAAELDQLDRPLLAARYVDRLERLVRALAAEAPRVIALEDLHWADEASVELLTRMLPLVDELPILLICATRPDRDAAGWRLVTAARDRFGDALTEIRLAPLNDDQSRELVAHLLVIESLPEQTRRHILQRAEGNPFFVEEVVRMLIERGAIVRHDEHWVAGPGIERVEIPAGIHALLLARIDRLPAEARSTLRIASVIGRQFGARVLAEVMAGR